MIRTQDQDTYSLVTDIRDGKLLLPEIQRGFVWKSTQVRDLFDSLYRKYPSGQLLVWETNDIPLSRQAHVEGLSSEQRSPRLLLDGQQRLTSLAAVMLGRDLIVRDIKKPIDIMFNVYTESFDVAARPKQHATSGWISLAKLFTQGAMAVYVDLQLDPKSPEAQTVFERLSKLDNIKTYQYRVNVLEHLSYEEVTHIFVRINSGGTKLGNADLGLAQVSSSWHGVTDVFEKYQQEVDKQGWGLKLDNNTLLRAVVVLLTNQNRMVRFLQDDGLQFTLEQLQDAWERAKKAIDRSIAFLVQDCFIDNLDMLPTRNLLLPLVAFFDRDNNSISSMQLKELSRWVYTALIWTRYSTASNSAIDQDLAALKREQPIQAMIENIREAGGERHITERELQSLRRNSPYMLIAYVLARRAGAQDWFNRTLISNDRVHDYQPHHIFSKSVLPARYRSKEQSPIVDQVANFVFLASPSKIINNSPYEYLRTIDPQCLRAQLIPMDQELWKPENFEGFLLRRRTMLAEAINQLLLSLTEGKRLWVSPPSKILEARVDTLERMLQDFVALRLSEDRGENAWGELVPHDVHGSVLSRIKKRKANKPYEAEKHETLRAKLAFCLFSDYTKIIKANWTLFSDVFGNLQKFEQYSTSVTEARNSLKHGQDLTDIDLASADAGLMWLDECLRYVNLQSDEEDEVAITK